MLLTHDKEPQNSFLSKRMVLPHCTIYTSLPALGILFQARFLKAQKMQGGILVGKISYRELPPKNPVSWTVSPSTCASPSRKQEYR